MSNVTPGRVPFSRVQRRRQWQSLGLVCGGLLALFLNGRTAEVVRSDLRTLDPVSLLSVRQVMAPTGNLRSVMLRSIEPFADRLKRLAAQNPQDTPLQVAAAKTSLQIGFGFISGSEDLERNKFFALSRIAAMSPNKALPCAAALRMAMQSLVPFHRTDWLEAASPYLSANYDTKQPFVAPDVAAAFEKFAAQGEQRDPQNAFFPMARVYLYLAQRRDKEAFAALDRAARLPQWEDYEQSEKAADIHLGEKINGSLNVMLQMQMAANASSWYVTLAGSQETLIRMAEVYERQGDTASGAALRTRLKRIGDLLHSQARTTTLRMMGTQIATLATRPDIKGQSFSLPPARSTNPKPYSDAIVIASLRNVWFLTVTVLCLLCGALASAAGYRRRFSTAPPKPLDSVTRSGIAFGVLLLLFGVATRAVFVPAVRPELLTYQGTLLAMLHHLTSQGTLLVMVLMLLLSWRFLWGRGFWKIAGKTLLISLLIGSVLCTAGSRTFGLGMLVSPYLSPDGVEMAAGFLACVLLPAIPALLWVLWAVFTGRQQRLPASVAIARHLQRTAVPVVTVLLLGYLVSLFQTVQAEIRAEGVVRQTLVNEWAISEGEVYPDLSVRGQ